MPVVPIEDTAKRWYALAMDTYTVRLSIVVLGLLFTIGHQFQAQAGYYPGSESGFGLEEISEEEALSFTSPHPLVLAAQEVSGVELMGMFELEPGMARYFEPRVEPEGGVEYLAEFRIVPHFEPAQPGGGEVSYSYPEGRVVVGFGVTRANDDGWEAMTIITYWVNPDGSVEELARHHAGAEYCEGIYALDLIRDGVVELIIPWATGVSGGGGVDIVAIVPTGGLATFGDDPEFSSIWSTWGSFTLLDFNEDGIWDIETYFPVLCSSCGYYSSNLLVFNNEKWDWIRGIAIDPGYYVEQAEFYAKLAAEVLKLKESSEAYKTDDPEVYGGYGVEINGEMHSLMPFIYEDGEIDEMWIDILIDYAEDLLRIVNHGDSIEISIN